MHVGGAGVAHVAGALGRDVEAEGTGAFLLGGKCRWRRFHGGVRQGLDRKWAGRTWAASGECRAGPASV